MSAPLESILLHEFEPLLRNPHLLTIAANFWPRKIDQRRFPPVREHYQIDSTTTILVIEHQPEATSRGQIVLLHGLEGSADAGYIQSLAQEALIHGFGVHRVNSRTCGGTEGLCETSYHSGLTTDTRTMLHKIANRQLGPIVLVGFSLGGNVALKLAGELGETDLVSAVCAISTPIDLAACVECIDKPANFLYRRRFLDRLKKRVQRKSVLTPHLYSTAGLDDVKTIWEFDDRITAPLFGFGTAANYYATQSASRYLDAIRIPALVITARNDPMVPFEIYNHPAFRSNPFLTLVAPEHGGHLGFLSRSKPRFWTDGLVLNWLHQLESLSGAGTMTVNLTSGR
ncbi:MAG: alpha/beta fold hydrolase [Acidobacteriaceae bacterium]|nr:alpha/beta fold hydrolase [Acidobacteriaceae bacterium]MBV9781985.1 alpha/beta fold hydrolase [Acidobacteriaceae bacterium]